MNGAFVLESLRQRPAESLALQPFQSGIRPIGDYFTARAATLDIESFADDTHRCADRLAQYIFHTFPEALDLVSGMTHRYEQATLYMARHPHGNELLSAGILRHLQAVEQRLVEGYIAAPTITLGSYPEQPHTEHVAGEYTRRLFLPPTIQERSLVWNHWAQNLITSGETSSLFTDTTFRHGAKVAAGSLLPAGNLWIEVNEGFARLAGGVEGRLGLPVSSEWGSTLGTWVIRSHIAEKDILTLSESIQPGMIDGMKLTPATYVQSYKPIVELIDRNPHLDIQGILSDGSWIYSSELSRLFPDQHISRLHDVAGRVAELGSAASIGMPIQTVFATYDPVRRAAYEAGNYQVGVAARFIDRAGMIDELGKYGIDIAA